MSTIRDVARLAGVSAITVSRVINKKGYVSLGTRDKVKRAIRALDYHPNVLARSFVTGESRMIALIIPDITNQFYATVARGVQDAAKDKGYHLLLCNTDGNQEEELEYMGMARERRIDGLAITPPETSENKKSDRYLQQLRGESFPIVMIGQRMDSPEIDIIKTDNQGGAHQAITYLIGQGHRRIAFIGGPLFQGGGPDRLRGYRQALKDHGLEADENLILEGNPQEDDGYRLARQLLAMPERPTAIFALNDMMAIGTLRASHEAGVKVPEELSVIGYDDIPLASLVVPRLSTVAQPKYELGKMAGDLLIDRIRKKGPEGWQSITLNTKLVIRDSTGQARQESLS
jgi:DNA-binding LacI/PurR family transcriptional regulator